MLIQSMHSAFIMPTKGSDQSAAYDLYMPEDGIAGSDFQMVGLGFCAAVPRGKMALLLPRSSMAKVGLELSNTIGLIDPDYRGEWKAAIRIKFGDRFEWTAGTRLLQFVLVPTFTDRLELVDELEKTARGAGGFGSTGEGVLEVSDPAIGD